MHAREHYSLFCVTGNMGRPGKASASTQKFGKVMHEYKTGHLHSGSKHGPLVHSPAQARAIAFSEARHAAAHKRAQQAHHTMHPSQQMQRARK
jgi:Family of unknown function (DUF6496)